MSINAREIPNTPRWINTEAGQIAWKEYVSWRGKAAHALSVHDRARLLAEAEQLAHSEELQVVATSVH